MNVRVFIYFDICKEWNCCFVLEILIGIVVSVASHKLGSISFFLACIFITCLNPVSTLKGKTLHACACFLGNNCVSTMIFDL